MAFVGSELAAILARRRHQDDPVAVDDNRPPPAKKEAQRPLPQTLEEKFGIGAGADKKSAARILPAKPRPQQERPSSAPDEAAGPPSTAATQLVPSSTKLNTSKVVTSPMMPSLPSVPPLFPATSPKTVAAAAAVRPATSWIKRASGSGPSATPPHGVGSGDGAEGGGARGTGTDSVRPVEALAGIPSPGQIGDVDPSMPKATANASATKGRGRGAKSWIRNANDDDRAVSAGADPHCSDESALELSSPALKSPSPVANGPRTLTRIWNDSSSKFGAAESNGKKNCIESATTVSSGLKNSVASIVSAGRESRTWKRNAKHTGSAADETSAVGSRSQGGNTTANANASAKGGETTEANQAGRGSRYYR